MKKIFIIILLLTGFAYSQTYNVGLTNAQVKTSLDNGLYSAVNVKTYGAVGDGVNDDTQEIQEALTNNRNVFLPSGTYRITAKLTIPTNTKFIGAGNSAILQADATFANEEGYAANPMIEVPAFNYGTLIENIKFIGVKDSADLYAWHGFSGSHSNIIRGCWFQRFYCADGGAVDPSNSYNNLFEGNYFDSCKIAIFMTGTLNQYGNIIKNNHIQNSEYGIRGEHPYRTIIEGNIVSQSTKGIWLQASYIGIGGNTISNNTVQTTDMGIYVGGVDGSRGNNITIIGNTVLSKICVQVNKSTNVLVSGNALWDSSRSGSGVYLTDYDSSVTVSNNTIRGGSVSLAASANVYGAYFIGNTLIGALDGGILIGATSSNTTISGNRYINISTLLLNSGTNTYQGLIAENSSPNALANNVIFYSTDLSAGNTIPSFYTEGTGVVSDVTLSSPNKTIAVRINGTVYYLQAKATND